MVEIWAMIKDNYVMNLVAWDGDAITLGQIPEGVTMVVAPDNVAIGWTYIDGVWNEPTS